jgi:cell division septum initiation protein DivIVA
MLKAKEHESLDNVYDELEQRIRRKGNIIISGVSERPNGTLEEKREHDKEAVDSILKEMEADDCTFEKCYRIGQPKSNGVRLLRVIGFDEDERNKILRKAKSLRNKESFRGIYVNPDLTPIQQREAKKMRDELKERRKNGEEVVIYRGKITEKSEIKNFQ